MERMPWREQLLHMHRSHESFRIKNDLPHTLRVYLMGPHGESWGEEQLAIPHHSELYRIPNGRYVRFTITYVDDRGVEKGICNDWIVEAGGVVHVKGQ
jgi:hypothetical protein